MRRSLIYIFLFFVILSVPVGAFVHPKDFNAKAQKEQSSRSPENESLIQREHHWVASNLGNFTMSGYPDRDVAFGLQYGQQSPDGPGWRVGVTRGSNKDVFGNSLVTLPIDMDMTWGDYMCCRVAWYVGAGLGYTFAQAAANRSGLNIHGLFGVEYLFTRTFGMVVEVRRYLQTLDGSNMDADLFTFGMKYRIQ